MLENLSNPQVIKHLVFKKAHEVLKFNMSQFGLDIEHIKSGDYNNKNRNQAKREELEKLKSCFDYDMQQFFEGMPRLYSSVKSYRRDAKKGSVLCGTHMDQYDIWKTAIQLTKQTAQSWWRDNHPRTSCTVKCDKETLGNVRIEQELQSYWKDRWYTDSW